LSPTEIKPLVVLDLERQKTDKRSFSRRQAIRPTADYEALSHTWAKNCRLRGYPLGNAKSNSQLRNSNVTWRL